MHKMRKGEQSFNLLNKILIALIIIGFLTKIYSFYINQNALLTGYSAISYATFIIGALIWPIIFILAAIKQSKFWYLVMSIWIFKDFLIFYSYYIVEPAMLGTANEYLLFNIGVAVLLLAMAVISMILYIKSFKSVKEALS